MLVAGGGEQIAPVWNTSITLALSVWLVGACLGETVKGVFEKAAAVSSRG
ncbi:hypothetical protein GCM10010383_73050 [Streptomyces lomondensis]|uniref:Uncharacterized protein n=1 Tax=Streptomyces lomondensis TaxID=68229 RepID=A0ABQ2XSJ0_9ACTN|nr:hypothetical protein GCM10010383_73050 [Streptomyces lomondensis]